MASVFNFFKAVLIPQVKAQDEAPNPQEELKVFTKFPTSWKISYFCFVKFIIAIIRFLQEKCGERPKIAAYYEKFQTCNDRVNSRAKTEETCAEELFDYMDALNNCVAETLFSKLK